MKKQAFNPYLPSWEYIPDGEPHVFGDRLYLFGSHDAFDGAAYCPNDYVCWSAPTDDLADWRYEGVIYQKTDDPINLDGSRKLFAPDVVRGPDGRYYLYYVFNTESVMGVAVCDTPAGRYRYYGTVRYPDGRPVGAAEGDLHQFDPGLLADDDGRIYLYSGSAPYSPSMLAHFGNLKRQVRGGYMMELESDMLTVKRGPEMVLPGLADAKGTGFAGHEFFEASSPRKIGGRYYLIYSSIHGHELCCAVSSRPDGDFTFGGVLLSNGDIGFQGRAPEDALNYIGNNHGSLEQINGQWYIFYHRQTNLHQFSRQACADPIAFAPDGSLPQAEMTSCGLNGGPLSGRGVYEARIACNLRSRSGVMSYTSRKALPGEHPYFTQDGTDREADGDQHIANMRTGALAGFKYFDFRGAATIAVTLRGDARGHVLISAQPDGPPAAEIPVAAAPSWGRFSAPLRLPDGVHPLYVTFRGEGYFDFLRFELA
ncbi:MAG: family 43 glycosylhydrolase [Oscillospiraceae bacterium]|nr:family 43 glycosylhydrolase [Oscillospiraceae bacterium]